MRSELLHALRVAAVRETLPSLMSSLKKTDSPIEAISPRSTLSQLEALRKMLNLYEVEYYEIVQELLPELAETFLHKKIAVSVEGVGDRPPWADDLP